MLRCILACNAKRLTPRSRLFRRDAKENADTHDAWISPVTVAACKITAPSEPVTMGWLLNKLDHLPEPVRLVTINAVLWGINTEDAPPFDRAPIHDEPIAPKASLGAAPLQRCC